MLERQPSVQLDADQLFANWGFADGEILARYFDAWNIDYSARAPAGRHSERCMLHGALIELVEAHLLPLAPPDFKTFNFEVTAHNPIRAEDVDGKSMCNGSDKAPDWAKRLTVECSDVQVYEAICEAWGGPPPTRAGHRS